MMNIVICSLLKFPDGDAGSIRQNILAKMFKDCGFDVFVVGLGSYTGNKEKEKDGYKYVSFRRQNNNKFNKILTYIFYYKNLIKLIKTKKPEYILIDDIGIIRTMKLKKFCKKNKIKLIHDSVEWYSPEQFKYGKFSLGYIKKDILNRFVIDESINVIAISKYLENYYNAKKIMCQRIPILISKEDLSHVKNVNLDKITFTYAGQPGKKDYLNLILDGFSLLNEEQLTKIQINIVGCTKTQIIESGYQLNKLKKIEKQINFYGRVSHKKVLEILQTTDFTLLLRDAEKRYAKAGFPTKMVESLSNSTPIICNLTSDMIMYLKDGVNSLIVKNCNSLEFSETLIKALNLTYKERKILFENSYKTAEKCFVYNDYLDNLSQILCLKNRI